MTGFEPLKQEVQQHQVQQTHGTGGEVRDGHQDLAWAYDFPTRQLLPIAGLVAFYNEKTDIDVDGVRLPRARTHFFR